MYSKFGVSCPFDVITAFETTGPNLLVSVSSNIWDMFLRYGKKIAHT